MFGSRVPTSLKIFLAALAIIDDLGAVIVIALFYTADLNLTALIGAALVWGNLFIFNRMKVKVLWPYLTLGAALWVLVFASGVHATLAGVMLALTIPLKLTPGTIDATPRRSNCDSAPGDCQQPKGNGQQFITAFWHIHLRSQDQANATARGSCREKRIEVLYCGRRPGKSC